MYIFLFFLAIILIWILPRLFFIIKTISILKKRMGEQQNPRYQKQYKNPKQSFEKDISDRVTIIEDKDE